MTLNNVFTFVVPISFYLANCADHGFFQHCEGFTGKIQRWLILSQVYGYMAIVLCLLLVSLCVIKKVTSSYLDCYSAIHFDLQRQEDERFKKIDAKRGGGGFV